MNTHSKTWLPKNIPNTYIGNIVKLNAIRRATKNFAFILTGNQHPIVFSDSPDSYTDGKSIVITKDTLDNVDATVGLVLHEASHILLSDMSIIQNWQKSNSKFQSMLQYRINTIDYDLKLVDVETIFSLVNWIEDRRIDRYVQDNAPGYIGYYSELYNFYFNSAEVTRKIQDNPPKEQIWDNYLFYIINFLNSKIDLDILPGLRDIYEKIDIENINRLNSIIEVIDLACEVFMDITHLLGKMPHESVKSMSDEDDTANGQGDPNHELDDISGEYEKQRRFVINDRGPIKKRFTDKERIDLSAISSGNGMLHEVNSRSVIVYRDINDELVYSGIFKIRTENTKYIEQNKEAINAGEVLGIQLAKKLHIRSENRSLKTTYKRNGKLDQRLMSKLGFKSENVFYQKSVDKFNNILIHISIDFSSSMNGTRIHKCLTSAAAIAKVASLVPGIDIQVTARACTDGLLSTYIIYDSKKHTFADLKKYWSILLPNGSTPECIVLDPLSHEMCNVRGYDDKIFINYSDGEPNVTEAESITKRFITNLKRHKWNILSYFITESDRSIPVTFSHMYGNDGVSIDVTSVTSIIKTLTPKFSETKN